MRTLTVTQAARIARMYLDGDRVETLLLDKTSHEDYDFESFNIVKASLMKAERSIPILNIPSFSGREAGKMDAILALLDYMCNDGGDVENIDYDAPYWEVSYGKRGVNWDVTEDGKFDSNGTYIEAIKANNEGKDYLNGRCRRFRTIGMQAAVDSSRTPEDKANNDFINSLPLMGSIPQVPGAPIYTEGIVFPNEYVEVMKTLDSLWEIYYNKALLGQIDVYEGIEQFREDAMKAGFGDVEPIIVEMFEKLGKF